MILISLVLAAVFAFVQPAAAQSTKGIGIVLLHGKWANPGKLSNIARDLQSAGLIVETPEMPWSGRRRYATSYEGAMAEIDAAVARLKAKGVERIIVGGHSMGANAALGFGARREGVSGLILLAPGHFPGLPGYDKPLAESVAKARDLVAAEKGVTKATFRDVNQGRVQDVTATASDYLSWFDPSGPAVTKSNASKVKPGTPVFCADGTKEKHPRCSYVLSSLPGSVKREQFSVNADHVGVAGAASGELIQWIKGL